MGTPELVSVLIPCWGCRDYIRETIESALAQDYQPLEILVVEDCGNDGTYEEALRFRDARLRVVRNDRNYGQYGNKNRALALAAGELVKYVDGDDLLEPNCVSRLVSAYHESGPGTGVVFGNFRWIDDAGHAAGRPAAWGVSGRVAGVDVLAAVTLQRQAGSRFGNVSCHLLRRDSLLSIGGFPNDNANPGDQETFLKLLCHTDACFVDEALTRYRLRAGSMTSRIPGVRECSDYLEMVKRLERYFRDRPELPAHLRDPAFLSEWKVWAGSHSIFANVLHKWRGRPNHMDEIRAMYRDAGLARELDAVMARDFPRFLVQVLKRKLRLALGLPDERPLLSRSALRRA